MKILSKIWNALNGNKTTIGMVVVLVSQGLKLFVPGLMTPEQYQFIETAGMVIGGGGLLHKGIKSSVINNALSKVNKNNQLKN